MKENHMKRNHSHIWLAAVLVLGLAACGGNANSPASPAAAGGADKPMTTLRVAHNSNAGVLPVWIAAEKGYFKAHGLDVGFTKVENIATLPPALGTSFDIALSVPTMVISAKAHGIDLVAVAGATLQEKGNRQSAVIASKASGVKSAKDLVGKTIGVQNTTGTFHLATRYWLKKSGVDPDSVKTVQVDPPAQADQLAAGRIDAVEAVAPFSTSMLAKPNSVDLGDPYGSMAPQIGAIEWVSQKKWAEQHKAVLDSFRKALQEGIDFSKNNKDEARKILQSYTGISDQVLATTKLPTFTVDVRKQDWELWLKAMREVGGFTGNVNVDSLLLA